MALRYVRGWLLLDLLPLLPLDYALAGRIVGNAPTTLDLGHAFRSLRLAKLHRWAFGATSRSGRHLSSLDVHYFSGALANMEGREPLGPFPLPFLDSVGQSFFQCSPPQKGHGRAGFSLQLPVLWLLACCDSQR